MAAELSDPRIGTLLEGRYRLDQRLAAGGMGVVYKGELVAIGKPVAIKFLHDALAAIPDLVKRFQREALTMSRLAHPHLVNVIDSGVTGGVPFLVMDFVSGRSLADVLADGPLPAPRAVAIARQILAGVKHAHASGVVHRDLKPDNIILLGDVEGDFAKILDFGLAKVVQESESATQLTNTGFALGTPGYMSPEQARGTESDERSDLYAVGVILFHMVTGRKPFVADSPLAVLRMHMDDAPPSPNAVAKGACSPELEKVILRALQKAPSARFQSAAEFAQALGATREAGEAPPTIEEAPRRRIPWRFAARAIVAAAACAVVVSAWSHLSHRQQQKMKRQLDEAVKLAQGAFDAQKKEPGATAPAHGKPQPAAAKPAAAKPTPPPPKLEAKAEPPRPAPVAPPPAAPAPTPAPVTPPQAEAPKPEPPHAEAKPEGDSKLPVEDDDDDKDDEALLEEPTATKDTPGARLEESAKAAPAPTPPVAAPPPASARATPQKPHLPTNGDAIKLLAANRVDEAIQLLYAVRRLMPRSGETALLLGHAYFRKLWRTDGLREYANAIRLAPAVRYNRTLHKNAVAALEDPTYRLARALIKTRVGTPALGELRRAARSAKSARVQQRAAKLAQQLAHSRRR